MRRRAFISLATVLPLAGCTSMLGGGGVDTTIEDDEIVEFEVEDGATLSISVDVQEVNEIGDDGDVDVEREGVGLRIDHVDQGVIDTRTIQDSESFELSVDTGGPHRVMVIGGTADVTIE
ncbi:hypothetical protein [Natrarchaeobaculum sulfurireducens]|uniref:Uncharacterized protein n=1 Tax=Natrarchaeobaculum sulfurireducens TaxID=2044521 RepID=A0A346PVH5_9EURY|nr:hypothetical protein [Natrarchaeobaculum sulfurireducens]AXR83520.1 hypothetical protein AArcMg_3547 [Natrarchaeobaculum sulfurireducens]